jgi:autotransporter-associated beta strand protein
VAVTSDPRHPGRSSVHRRKNSFKKMLDRRPILCKKRAEFDRLNQNTRAPEMPMKKTSFFVSARVHPLGGIGLLTGILVFLQTQYLPAPSGTWSNVSGSWGDTANWVGGIICDGAGSTFSTVAVSPSAVTRTVTLDQPRTIGQVNNINVNGVNRAFRMTDGGNTSRTLTLDMGGTARPLFAVLNGPTTLTLALAGSDGVRFYMNNAGATATLTITRVQQYSGDTEIANKGAGSLIVGVTDVFPHGAGKGNLVFTNFNGYGVLDLATFNVTVNGLVSIGAGGTIYANGAAGTSTLTVGDGDANGDFGGVIQNGTRTVALTKIGSGTQILSGNNTYSGPTTVSAGTLLVNGAVGSGNVTVASGATLGGTGTIGGPATANGTVAPGASAGTLTFQNDLNLAGSAVLSFELKGNDTTIGSGVNDLISVGGNLTLDGTLNVAEIGAGSFLLASPGDTWRLINYSGTLTDNGLTLGSMPSLQSGYYFVVDTATAGQVNLRVVPEPSAAVLGLIGGLGLLLVVRRRWS